MRIERAGRDETVGIVLVLAVDQSLVSPAGADDANPARSKPRQFLTDAIWHVPFANTSQHDAARGIAHLPVQVGPIETGNPNGMGMGPGGFPGMGMGPSFPDMPGAGGEHVGGYKTNGY